MSACAVLTGGGQNVRVSEAKAKLILEKAKELRYEPNHMGRALRTRRTDTIGVVFQHLTGFGDEPYYYQQLLDGIMTALFPKGYNLSLCPALVGPDGAIRIWNGKFDGILWCSPDLIEASIESVKHLRMPFVMVHAPLEVAGEVPTFAADNDQAMGRVVDHLGDLGHQSIGFVVKPHIVKTVEGKGRASAFLDAAAKRGIKADILLWEHECEDLALYATENPPHTALAAYNDVHAGHILSRAIELGIRVPEGLSVVGFDSSKFCERTQPPLTSIHQPIERIAREATECLLRLIDADPQGEPIYQDHSTLYDCRLDVRGSTAAPTPHRRGT